MGRTEEGCGCPTAVHLHSLHLGLAGGDGGYADPPDDDKPPLCDARAIAGEETEEVQWLLHRLLIIQPYS